MGMEWSIFVIIMGMDNIPIPIIIGNITVMGMGMENNGNGMEHIHNSNGYTRK